MQKSIGYDSTHFKQSFKENCSHSSRRTSTATKLTNLHTLTWRNAGLSGFRLTKVVRSKPVGRIYASRNYHLTSQKTFRHGHSVSRQRPSLVRANSCSTTHSFTCKQVSDQVMIFHHFLRTYVYSVSAAKWNKGIILPLRIRQELKWLRAVSLPVSPPPIL